MRGGGKRYTLGRGGEIFSAEKKGLAQTGGDMQMKKDDGHKAKGVEGVSNQKKRGGGK